MAVNYLVALYYMTMVEDGISIVGWCYTLYKLWATRLLVLKWLSVMMLVSCVSWVAFIEVSYKFL